MHACDLNKVYFLTVDLGIIAVSCAELMSFDERVDNASRIIMTPSLILIWSFSDPIHPQVLRSAC